MRHDAPSSRIRFCLRTKIFSPVQPTVHTHPVKTVIENESFRKRSPEWGFFKTQFWVPGNAHAPIKDGTVFSHYCVFEWTDKNDSKTHRVDADFVKTEKKNPRFQTKTDTCGLRMRSWWGQLCEKPKQDDWAIKKHRGFTLPQLPLDPPSDCPLNQVAPNSNGRYSYLCAVEKV